MDTSFLDSFKEQLNLPGGYDKTDIDLNKKLQDARHDLQEATSEIEQLWNTVESLYAETRIENVATTELISQIKSPIVRNVPLPRNADTLSTSEKAGYVFYYLKFLGFALRKSIEEYHTTKEHLEGIHKSINTHTVKTDVKRSGSLKLPELDGQKELKRGVQAKPPQSATPSPPQPEKPKPNSKR